MFDPSRFTRPTSNDTLLSSPQEVLNFASALNLREPVRVLVRRENNQSENNTATSTPNPRGVKHWFLYLAMGNGAAPGGRGPGRQESPASREWKLEALADLCADAEFSQAVVYCSSIDSVEAVAYKLSSRNIDALALHGDMGASARHAILSKFRSGNVGQGRGMAAKRVLVVYDALCRTLSDIHQVAMVVNFDLPRAVEDYVHR
jgi:superfamily II DNA/RNA helicase